MATLLANGGLGDVSDVSQRRRTMLLVMMSLVMGLEQRLTWIIYQAMHYG